MAFVSWLFMRSALLVLGLCRTAVGVTLCGAGLLLGGIF